MNSKILHFAYFLLLLHGVAGKVKKVESYDRIDHLAPAQIPAHVRGAAVEAALDRHTACLDYEVEVGGERNRSPPGSQNAGPAGIWRIYPTDQSTSEISHDTYAVHGFLCFAPSEEFLLHSLSNRRFIPYVKRERDL